jgi:hypothetical protein
MIVRKFVIYFFTSVGVFYTIWSIQDYFNWLSNFSRNYIFLTALIFAILFLLRGKSKSFDTSGDNSN